MFYQLEHIGSLEHMTVEKNKDFSFPPHIHQCFEIIVLHSGSMNVTIDEKVYVLNAGDAVLIFPNQIHSLESENSEHTLCIFSPEIVKTFSRKTSEKTPKSNRLVLDENTLKLFYQLSEDCSEMFKKGVLYLICDIFEKNTQYTNTASCHKTLLHNIFFFVDNNFAGDCSLVSLADEVGYNYSYLSRYFKKAVGISFNNYVNNYRLNHACYLLRNSDDSIIHCAFDSGFVSLRSFNRNFKERFKISPVQYRNLSKKTE